MKTLHIHIGTAKTGTTSIQKFCADNAKILEKKGYCYPLFPQFCSEVSSLRAHFLMESATEDPKDECPEKEKNIFRKGMDKVCGLFHSYDNVILSDESIWRGMDCERKDFWEVMKREAEAGQFRIHVIVYLRRQDSYFTSLWNQKVKSHKCKESFEDFAANTDVLRLDYFYKLEKIASIIGKENITVRRFVPGEFEGGSIYSDFLLAIGLSLTDEYSIEKGVYNTGLYGNNIEIKRVLNAIPQMDSEAMRELIVPALRECSKISKRPYSCAVCSQGEIKEFLSRYEEGNRKVAKEYLNLADEALFDDDISDVPKWQKDNPYMLDDIVRFLGMTILSLHQDNMEIKKDVVKIRKILYYMKHPFEAVRKAGRKISGKK